MYNIYFYTWMHSLNVPGEHSVQAGVDDEHHHGQAQVEVVPLDRGLADGLPLDPHPGHLVQGKVLGAQAKRRGGHQGLEREGAEEGTRQVNQDFFLGSSGPTR